MSEQAMYLKPNVVFEPLIDRWYAWPHMISPATAAFNLANRQLKIMNSYIQAPAVHAAACKNPKMKGGPFIDLGGKKVNKVKELRTHFQDDRGQMIELAQAMHELDVLLKNEASGYSLHPLYEKVPERLKGYVELVYDRNNNATFRVIEPLLYHSEYYDESSQSVALFLTENDERPFALSTPRVDDEGVVHLHIPFKHEFIDALARTKKEPRPISELKAMLAGHDFDEAMFESFFTTEAPPAYEPYTGDRIRMRYFGHACIMVETKDVSILVDPLISYYGYDTSIDHFSDADLPDVIDYVLITHNHQDHVLLETLLPLRHKVRNIVVPKGSGGTLQDPDLKLMLNKVGFNNVVELGELHTLNFVDANITGLPFMGEHADLDIRTKICHHVEVSGFSMIFLADSCNIEPRLYDHIQKIMGNVDVVFLGMECDGAPLSWLYGPLLPEEPNRDQDNSRRLSGCNYDKGMALVDTFSPKEIYVYAMGQEPWVEFISSIKYTDESNPIVQSNRLVEVCNKQGVTAERLFGEKELLYQRKAAPVA